jgi:hypothetical protein
MITLGGGVRGLARHAQRHPYFHDRVSLFAYTVNVLLEEHGAGRISGLVHRDQRPTPMTMRSLRAVCLVSPRRDQPLGGPVLEGRNFGASGDRKAATIMT